MSRRLWIIAAATVLIATGVCYGEEEVQGSGSLFEQDTLSNNWFGLGEVLEEQAVLQGDIKSFELAALQVDVVHAWQLAHDASGQAGLLGQTILFSEVGIVFECACFRLLALTSLLLKVSQDTADLRVSVLGLFFPIVLIISVFSS